MEQIFIILFVVVLFILLTCNKKEGMCSCQARGLDYYGTRKFMDWEETMRRKNKIKN